MAARKLPDWTPLGWSALALVAAYGLATAASPSWRLSAENSLLIAVCVVAFYIFNERRLFSTSLLVRLLAVVAGLVSLRAMLQLFDMYGEWFSAVEAVKGLEFSQLLPPPALRLQTVLNHPNNLAMFLNIALPFALVLALQPRSWLERAAALAVLILGCTALFFTQSRGAWLGTMASQPIFWLLFATRNEPHLSPKPLITWVRRHETTPIGIRSLCCADGARGGRGIYGATAMAVPSHDRITLDTVSAALRMFADHPLTGVGPQVYDVLNGSYGVHRPEWTIVHNAYIQVLADIGIVGAAVVLIGGVITARSLFRAWQSSTSEHRLIIAACVAAIVATLVHGLSDSPPTWNVALLPFAMVLAIAMRFVPEPTQKPRGISRLPSFVAIGLIPLIMVGWWAMDGAHSHYNKSISASAAGDLPQSAREAMAAADADPHSLVYKLQAGISLVTLSQDETNAAVWPDALQQGIEYLRGATAEDPHNGMAYANLGLALQMAGDDEGAAEAARRALIEAPEDVTIATVAGSIFEHAGLSNEAIDAYGLRCGRSQPGAIALLGDYRYSPVASRSGAGGERARCLRTGSPGRHLRHLRRRPASAR